MRVAVAGLGDRPFEELTRIARTDPSFEARLLAIQRLSGYRRPQAFEVIVERLADDHASVRSDAIHHLIASSNEAVVERLAIEVGQGPVERRTRLEEALETALQSNDYRHRWFAVWFSWKMGTPASTPRFVHALGDDHRDVRTLAQSVLSASTDPEVPTLLVRLLTEAPSQESRTGALSVLIERRDARAIGPLISEWRTGPVFSGGWIEEQLRAFGPAAIEELANLLREDSPEMQVWAANMLAEIEDPRVIGILKTAVDANDASVRSTVLAALARQKASDLLEILLRGLRDRDPDVRSQAVTLLREEPGAVEPLIEACVQDPHGPVRAEAARALGRLGDPVAGSALAQTFVRAARENDNTVLREASDALKRLGEDATDHLIPALDDAIANVRMCAAWMLGEVGNQRARDPLSALTTDPDPGVQEAAATALERIGGDAR